MNYLKIYNELIDNRVKNVLSKKDCYIEKHHIIPRSFGGGNEKSNLVALTAREHYIAHLLLYKIYKNDGILGKKMLNAVIRMQNKGKEGTQSYINRNFRFNSHLYEKLRCEFAANISKVMKVVAEEKNWMKGKTYAFNAVTGECIRVDLETFVFENDWYRGRISNEKELETKRKIIERYRPYIDIFRDTVISKIVIHSELRKMRKEHSGDAIEISKHCGINIEYSRDSGITRKEHGKLKKMLDEKKKQEIELNRINREKKVLELTEYYTLLYNAYLEHGFDYIVKTFGYDKTRENLSRKFKKYVKEYSTNALLKATVALRKKNKEFKDSYAETLHMTEDEKIKLYSDMYADYKEKGFDFVVEKYDYRRTHGALLWNFRKFVKEYVPAPTFRWNGKGVDQNTRKNEPK